MPTRLRELSGSPQFAHVGFLFAPVPSGVSIGAAFVGPLNRAANQRETVMEPMIQPSGSPSSSGQYEFNTAENELFAALAAKMRFVGLVLGVLGAIYLILGALLIFMALSGQAPIATTQPPAGGTATTGRLGVEHSIGYIIGGIIYLAMGGWTRNGAAAFRRIVDTEGSDIPHLMEAATNLRKVYTLQFWLILIGLITLIALTTIMVVAYATRS
jgi:hypothetical protein